MTSHGSRLRLESFSGCCGARARLNLLPSVLDGPPVTSGTTNVDFNELMRAGLAGPAVAGPPRRSVGTENVAVTTVDAFVVERKIPLPDRWLKGFDEVQAPGRPMRLVAELARRHRRGVQADPRRRRLQHPSQEPAAGRRIAETVFAAANLPTPSDAITQLAGQKEQQPPRGRNPPPHPPLAATHPSPAHGCGTLHALLCRLPQP